LKRLKSDLLTSQKQKVDLEKRIEHMAKLLSKAESIIARTNTITLTSMMETLRKKETNVLNNRDLLKKIQECLHLYLTWSTMFHHTCDS
jgi:hypothetical protein